uniref:Uncharacterized protein n=1 Tax=Arundo donax TaxID=35708 RepID=A0A0A9CE63_ARUDO
MFTKICIKYTSLKYDYTYRLYVLLKSWTYTDVQSTTHCSSFFFFGPV